MRAVAATDRVEPRSVVVLFRELAPDRRTRSTTRRAERDQLLAQRLRVP
jgi:hypothetical protein